jgi:hypothetical protein
MEEKSLTDVIGQLAEAAGIAEPAPPAKPASGKTSLQADTLRVLAGLTGGEAGGAIFEFLNGRGTLLESTAAALTRGKKTAVNELAELLTRQFKMSPAAASVVAALLIKLFPSIGKLTGAAPAPKKKARRKTKPKRETSSTTTKRKKKTAAKEKPAPKKKTTTKKTKK